ncbi:Outer membrane protein beta-barrel domain [Shewanella psychrophila]|uniref:Outer membrane protein beta-barrel domain n=1 Tax=Shewanella psychrophila TaxID=225848 RepID=A0A1S6HU43_9GAMM|nr:porin family protein [Shewanella psychrophila]AQS39080.1 Outer membrane protein beta-barrel domain [Shewanella psychrophila]
MNNSLAALLLVSLGGLASQALAQNDMSSNDSGPAQQVRGWFIEGTAGLGLSKEAEESNLYWRAGTGYRLNQYLDLGVAVSSLHDGVANSEAVEAFMRPKFSLGEGYALYSELGYRDEGDGLFAGLGVKYQVTPSWEVNLGYRWYQQPISEARGDSYTLAIGVQYLFGQSKKYQHVSNYDFSDEPVPIVTQPAAVVKAPVVALPLVSAETCRTTIAMSDLDNIGQVYEPNNCHLAKRFNDYQGCKSVLNAQGAADLNAANLETHVIVKGAWLTLIAHEHCITLDALTELNPWIKTRIDNNKYIYPKEKLNLPVK